MFVQCDQSLRPFLPQLQTTFIKSLQDPNRIVRIKSANALGQLIVIQARADQVFIELMAGLKAATETAIRFVTATTLLSRKSTRKSLSNVGVKT